MVLALAGCGGDDEPEPGGEPTRVTVEEAIEGGDGRYVVRGPLIVEGDRPRLCSAILESYPPQCGRPSLVVDGLDLSTIELQSAEGTDVRWAESVELAGELRGETFTVE